MGLSVLILRNSWAKWEALVKISFLALKFQHPWFRRSKYRVQFCSPKLSIGGGYIGVISSLPPTKAAETEVLRERAVHWMRWRGVGKTGRDIEE